jgi:hypothetical protein
MPTALVSHGPAGAFVLATGGGENGVNARNHAGIEVTGGKTRFDPLLNDALGDGVWDSALQAVANLEEHLPILNEHEQHGTVVLALLPYRPGLRHPNRVVLNGGFGLHLGKDGDNDLARVATLEILQLTIQLIGDRRRDNSGVVIEVARRFGRDHFGCPRLRVQHPNGEEKQDKTQAAARPPVAPMPYVIDPGTPHKSLGFGRR